jgi:hypothetical protein
MQAICGNSCGFCLYAFASASLALWSQNSGQLNNMISSVITRSELNPSSYTPTVRQVFNNEQPHPYDHNGFALY